MDDICEFSILGSSNSTDKLKRYFKSLLPSGVPSSMPCPCCKKVMVRSDRYKKERSNLHPLMAIAKVLSTTNYSQGNNEGVSVLCEECCNKSNKTVLLPTCYVILEEEQD